MIRFLALAAIVALLGMTAAADPKPNSLFTTQPSFPGRKPLLKPLKLPSVPSGLAIWGSTGRDQLGRIYFGISPDSGREASAHLVMYDPVADLCTDLGGTVEQLRRAGVFKPGIGQNKIHTRILQAADGYLYFGSMDEAGEREDGSRLPTHGSHFWRVRPGSEAWEHLAAVPEGVIANAVGGPYVYFLSYFGHVLHQFDTRTSTITKRIAVGATGGHISRNFLADDRGHVYLPRLHGGEAVLVEYDDQLKERSTTPLADYGTKPDSTSHGLVSTVALKDGAHAFLTDRGRLYRIAGKGVEDLGRIHPTGKTCYCATLFTFDGQTSVCGLVQSVTEPEKRYEWFNFDLATRKTTLTPVDVPLPGKDYKSLLIYGSTTRDNRGHFYVAGRYITNGQSVPAAWRIVP